MFLCEYMFSFFCNKCLGVDVQIQLHIHCDSYNQSQVITSVGKDVKESEFLNIGGGNVKCSAT